jgi:hypothetical protein
MVTPVSGMLHQPSLDVKAELPELRKTEETYGDMEEIGRTVLGTWSPGVKRRR